MKTTLRTLPLLVIAALAQTALAQVYSPTVFYRDVSLGTWTTIQGVAWSPTTGGVYTNAAPVTNVYRVLGTNSAGRTPIGTGIVAVITGTTNGTTNAVNICWTTVGGISGYIVEKSYNAGTTFTNLAFLSASSTNWVDTGTNVWSATTWSTNLWTPIPYPTAPWAGGDVGALLINGSRPMAAPLNMGSYGVTNLESIYDEDGATYALLDENELSLATIGNAYAAFLSAFGNLTLVNPLGGFLRLAGDITYDNSFQLRGNTNATFQITYHASGPGGLPIITWSTNGIGLMTVYGDLLPARSNAFSLGSSAAPWHSLYVGTNSIYMGPANGAVRIFSYDQDGGAIVALTNVLVKGEILMNGNAVLTNANTMLITTVTATNQAFAVTETAVAWNWRPASTNVTLAPTFTGPASAWTGAAVIDLIQTNCSIAWPAGQAFYSAGARVTNAPSIMLHTRFLLDWWDGVLCIGVMSTNGAPTP